MALAQSMGELSHLVVTGTGLFGLSVNIMPTPSRQAVDVGRFAYIMFLRVSRLMLLLQ